MPQDANNDNISEFDHISESRQKLSVSHPVNLRADAAWVLFNILDNGYSASELMPKVWQRYAESKDRAWLQEVIYGCLRNLPSLQYWLRNLLDKPLKKQQKIVEHLIVVGMYQLEFARTADHAAVSETVNACKVIKQHRLSGLVNAILRGFQRHDVPALKVDSPHISVGLPKWLYRKLTESYAEGAKDIASQSRLRAPLWLRINTLKISADDYCEQLLNNNIQFEFHPPISIKIESAGEITLLPGYEDGLFAVQDLAAQQAAVLLDPQAGDIVLDCCAAPGGKTAAILEHQPNLKQLFAIDVYENRLSKISENFLRLGHLPKYEEKLEFLLADAKTLGSQDNQPLFNNILFDKILLDAPCSATGVIRRHPDIMWLRKPADIDALCELQFEILEQAWRKLKTGGTLLYATCSILPQENSQQISRFLSTHSDAKILPIETAENEHSDYWQILPGQKNMDGFFYARLIKC